MSGLKALNNAKQLPVKQQEPITRTYTVSDDLALGGVETVGFVEISLSP